MCVLSVWCVWLQGDWWHTWAESKTGNVSTPLDTTNKYCIDITKPASPYKSGPARVAAAAAPAKHDDGDDHYGHASEHWGEAYVFTGLFQSVGAHGDVEGNGLFEVRRGGAVLRPRLCL